MLTREICCNCGKSSPVGFSVPDSVWEQSVPVKYINRTLCIICFASFSDESLVKWDDEIEFFPVSLKTVMELENNA